MDKSENDDKTKKAGEIYILPKKDNKLMMTLNCFEHKMEFHCIKMEF